MKKLIFMLLCIASGYAQTTASTVKLEKVYNLDVSSEGKPSYKETGSVAIYHGETLPVYMTVKGKLFIWVISKKTGNKYKKYIN